MTSEEIRKRFLAFFEKRGHVVVPSASLVPENDPSVLFTTAGMQPLVPYLMGAPHPAGKRLVNVQKCVRTQDIDEVGDNTHDTFFEMLGNWSLGDYFKEDAIKWSYEFLTDKEEGLGLDPTRLYVTCFAGDEDAPKDTESARIWKDLGIPDERIYFLGKDDNWWSPGDNGPCGPDTEMFYDVKGGLDLKSLEEFKAADDRQDVVEVWNDVFMEYEKKDGKVIGRLSQKNVDTGAGLERLTMVMQGKDNIFDTDLFGSLFSSLTEAAEHKDERSLRIVADHVRTSVFMVGDGVVPSNTDRGYILRRLLRRAIRHADVLRLSRSLDSFISVIVQKYCGVYPNLKEKNIADLIVDEETRFRKTLSQGLKQFNWKASILEDGEVINNELPASIAFDLFTTYGFPYELIKEEALARGMTVDDEQFRNRMETHRVQSRKGAEQKFKGGLADASEKTTMLHTCTHLMLAGLRKYLGDDVHQAGSNITQERTRFDFTYPQKVDRETLDKVEAYVNEAIEKKCPVIIKQMPKEEARASGVEGSFWEKYPDMVNVYCVECDDLPAPRPDTYYVYVILCNDDSMYIDQTNDLQKRWREHVAGTAAQHTKKHRPLKIIHYEEFGSRTETVKRERDLKTGFGRKWLKREFQAGRTRQAGGTVYSQELCGGPHVANTGDIKGTFKIKKEEASSAGVRRIKAVLE